MAASLILHLIPALLPLIQTPGSGIETIYVVEFCHADVGFNAPPSVMQQRNHDRTVAALNLLDSEPEFRWTVETGYQLEGFLDRASSANRNRLIQRLSEGRMDFGANYTNLHSGNCGEEQFHRQLYPSAGFAAELGHLPRTVFLNDVPGFSLAMPRILASAGVDFAVLGPNDFLGGNPAIPLQDRPFWWQARDGSRTLTWTTVGSYAEGFVEWGMVNLSTMNVKIPARLAEFEAAGYPYDAVMVLRAFDDTFPNNGMVNLADQWNQTHTSPKIKLATADEFFDYLWNRYGDVFPSYEGDASGYWEDVTTVTPASTASVRLARSHLPEVEALRTLLHLYQRLPYPARELQDAWQYSLIFDEHSGGGVGWPGLLSQAEVEQENQEFVAVAQACKNLVERSLEEALAVAGPILVPNGEQGLVLFNPLGQAYRGLVEVHTGTAQPSDLRLIDPQSGTEARLRWLEDSRSSFAVEVDLPARGWRRYSVTGGGTTPPPPAWNPGTQINLNGFQLSVDPLSGTAEQLIELASGFDWLDSPHPHPLGNIQSGLQLEVFFGQTVDRNPPLGSIMVEDPGPLFRRLRVLDPQGFVLREYRLHEQGPRVDLRLWLRRSALPFVPFADHSAHYGVDFAAHLTPPVRLFLDGPDGFFEAGAESLPGAQLASFGVARSARLQGSQGRWLAVSSLHTPIVDLGEMHGAALLDLEDDERSLAWKLIRHHNEGQVAGGAIVSFDVEPGMPDVIPFHFVARYGDAGQAPPSGEITRRDLTPPFAAWVELGQGSSSLPVSQPLLPWNGPGELLAWKRSEADHGMVFRIRGDASGGVAQITLPATTSGVWICDLVERPLQALSVTAGVVDVPLIPEGVVSLLVLDP